jgi:hypothetical protein
MAKQHYDLFQEVVSFENVRVLGGKVKCKNPSTR